MKAESFIFTAVQRPMTLFGMPPRLLAVCAGSCGILFALLIMLGSLPLALIVPSLMFTALFVFLYRRTRQDHHFETLLLVPPRFWRGRRGRRLVAGRPAGNKARNTGGRS